MGKTTFAMNIAGERGGDQRTAGGGLLDGDAGRGADHAHDLVARPGQPAGGALGQTRRRRLARVTSAVNILNNTKLFIDDTPALTPTELRARCRRLTKEHGNLGLVVIDLPAADAGAGVGENRATEISAISRALKALAKELNVPVIALSQLNRSLEQRPNKRPVMSGSA